MCSSRKYPCPPQGRLMEIPRGRGVAKVQYFEGKYDTKMKFPEGCGWVCVCVWGGGGGGQFKKLSVGGVWILPGTTQ